MKLIVGGSWVRRGMVGYFHRFLASPMRLLIAASLPGRHVDLAVFEETDMLASGLGAVAALRRWTGRLLLELKVDESYFDCCATVVDVCTTSAMWTDGPDEGC